MNRDKLIKTGIILVGIPLFKCSLPLGLVWSIAAPLIWKHNQIAEEFKKIKEEIILQQEQKVLEQLAPQFQELQKITQVYENQVLQAKIEARRLSDPKTYNKEKEKREQKFVQYISKLKFSKIQEGNSKKKFIIGPISVGKSSLLKNFFGAEVEVGMGETTLSVNMVCYNEEVEIYDSPGINEDYDITKFDNLVGLFQMDEFYVCYNSSIKNVQLILRILSAVKMASNNRQKIYLVRTQCDKFTAKNIRSLSQELKADQEYLQSMKDKKMIPQTYKILATSSERDQHFEDNGNLMEHLNPGKKKLQIVSKNKNDQMSETNQTDQQKQYHQLPFKN